MKHVLVYAGVATGLLGSVSANATVDQYLSGGIPTVSFIPNATLIAGQPTPLSALLTYNIPTDTNCVFRDSALSAPTGAGPCGWSYGFIDLGQRSEITGAGTAVNGDEIAVLFGSVPGASWPSYQNVFFTAPTAGTAVISGFSNSQPYNNGYGAPIQYFSGSAPVCSPSFNCVPLKTPAQMALYDFYNQYVIPISNELNKIGKDLTYIGAGMSLVGGAMLADPLTVPAGYELLLQEAVLLGAGSEGSLSGFRSDLPPLTDPPITLPTLTPSGLVTSQIIADFNSALQNEAQLVADGSTLRGLVQQLQTALTNNDYTTAASLEAQIQAAFTTLGGSSGTQASLYAMLLKEIDDAGIQDFTITAADFAAFLTNIETMGFPSQEVNLFQEMGFTQADISNIASQVLGLNFDDIPDSLYLLLTQAGAEHRDIMQITDATVPEPATLILLGGALLLCLATAWRRDCSTAE